jgi:hypothetical protein
MDLDDQVVIEHPLDGSVERAGTEADVAIRPRQHFLDNAVAVAVFVRQGHQDVKDSWLQHRPTISIVDIDDNVGSRVHWFRGSKVISR